jgi:hypothetical protein
MGQSLVLDPSSTQVLYEQCKSEDQTIALSCAAYLTGVAEVMAILGAFAENPKLTASERADWARIGLCNSDYSPGQLQQAFMDWAVKNQTEWQKPREYGAIRAFKQAWPCK